MLSFIQKDLLMFWRDRKELVTVLTLPILLVVVLNFAFSGLLGSDDELSLDLQLAVVNQDDESNAMAELERRLTAEAGLEAEEAAAIVERAAAMQPVQLLFDYLNSEGLRQWLTIHELQESEAKARIQDGELDAMLLIPEGFTVDSLYAALVEEMPAASLKYLMERQTNDNQILFLMIQGFVETINFQFIGREMGAEPGAAVMPEGGFEQLGGGKAFSISEYFTITMAALFSLFLAATVATKTGVEIRQQVFHRILLSENHSSLFLLGKMAATLILTWLQMLFVFILSHLILDVFADRSSDFWLGAIAIITLLALAISGVSALFTSILLRMPNIDAANGLFMLIIMVFGIIGGNFAPITLLPRWLQQIGEWTPNGLFLAILTEWVKFEEPSGIALSCLLLAGFFLLFAVLGVALYPKRGKA